MPRRPRVVNHAHESLAHSPAPGQHRREPNKARRSTGDRRVSAGRGRHERNRRKRAVDATGSPPATVCRSPAEHRYKKFNKYFMREIL
ncbi:hypothetical protein E2P84_03365 [Burkholderia cepacia]|uniref:Uncharacterized protein n=1 Tax=Burkholderia cepacia TaxID=292 RepID=A0AAX2RX11_BURCE|nr:hypothetical protein E2P84_03365 [Burkholderia cepacia]TET02661.1 hypothetical protein E3D36_12485 [Burkholderia cepacia]TEU45316.1 hypothetical protein E3D39_09985 [Burkholderia cepacia]TEU49712.1 hypothetical protein E3D38_19605 [Burkholderia cepacia]TEU52273.1 hypothetical protein E3D37_06350 [Burkholderia cepacia]